MSAAENTAVVVPATLTVTGKEWQTVCRFASKDDNRANLNQIAIYSDGSMAATDGHRLILRMVGGTETTDRGVPMLVSLDDAKKIGKLAGAKGSIAVGEGQVTVDGIEIPCVSRTATFPPVHQVTQPPVNKPKPVMPSRWGVSARYMGEAMTALSKVCLETTTTAVKVRTYGPLDPIAIEANGEGCTWFAVVMPVRI